jgi:hypothetical protein
MLRAVLAVIVGYVVTSVLIFACFTGAYLLMGADNAFRPGSYDISHRWLALAFVVDFVAAVIGGLVCAAIAKGGKAPLALAALTLVLGVLLAIPSMMAVRNTGPTIRRGSVSNLEAMQRAKEPIWAPLLTPLVGAVGVLVGAKLKRRS